MFTFATSKHCLPLTKTFPPKQMFNGFILFKCLHWPLYKTHKNFPLKSWQMFNVFIFFKWSNVYIGHYCVPLTFSTLMLSDIMFTNVQLFQCSNVQTLIHLTMLISQWQQGWGWRSEYWNCRNKSNCICIGICTSICTCIGLYLHFY